MNAAVSSDVLPSLVAVILVLIFFFKAVLLFVAVPGFPGCTQAFVGLGCVGATLCLWCSDVSPVQSTGSRLIGFTRF